MKLFPHPPCPTLSWSLAFSIPIITFGFSRHLPSSTTDAGWGPPHFIIESCYNSVCDYFFFVFSFFSNACLTSCFPDITHCNSVHHLRLQPVASSHSPAEEQIYCTMSRSFENVARMPRGAIARRHFVVRMRSSLYLIEI